MSHFAEINSDNIVVNVIVAEQDFINSGIIGDSFNFIQTSYNHNFRNKYAGIGDTWDASRNAFISPQPYPSWTLSDDLLLWEAPVAYPDDGKFYDWNEENQSWDAVTDEP